MLGEGGGMMIQNISTGNAELKPVTYRDFLEIFNEEKEVIVLPHRSIDNETHFEPGYHMHYGQITIEQW
jgi:hypothetical protein